MSAARRRRGEQGQSLVLVVLTMTLLLGAASMAIDVGRLVAERRFLQNAADAAALAAATVLTQGRTTAEADAVAREVLARNFAHEPTGRPPAMPSLVPVYAPGQVGVPGHLVDGILITPGEVRVALRNTVDYTFGRAVGMTGQRVDARARAGFAGGLLPIAVRQYLKPPGPTNGALSPCAHDENRFMAVFATADTACLGTDTDATLRVDPTAGAPFDAANPDNDRRRHGPIITILGQGSSPDNAASFRGFIVLDIRDFATTTSQRYSNGVTAGTNPSTLKDLQSGWIRRGGYPGPGFPPVTFPPDPRHQVAIMDGNAAGQSVDAVEDRFDVGDEVLIAVYPGVVMSIPEFTLSQPAQISLPTTGEVAFAGSLRVSRNQAFQGTVDMSTLADTLDPRHPMTLGTLVGSDPIEYDPDPVAPSLGNGTTVRLEDLDTAGAAPGIHVVWIKGQAGSPYLSAKLVPLAIRIGDVTRDFTLTADATGKVATNAGDTVTFTLLLTNTPNRSTNFGNPVSLSVDAPYPAGTGSVTFSTTSAAPSRNGTAVTLSINTGTLPQGLHPFVVRATGMNADPTPRPVTHLLPLSINVAPSGTPGSDEYVDLTGFALMRITRIDSNSVQAYAITPVIPDLSDPRLRQGQKARLLPW